MEKQTPNENSFALVVDLLAEMVLALLPATSLRRKARLDPRTLRLVERALERQDEAFADRELTAWSLGTYDFTEVA